MFVPDRGADRVYVYRISPKNVTRVGDIEVLPGTGPRHATFWKLGGETSLMILLGELDNSLRVYSINEGSSSGGLQVTLLQTISTLGEDHERSHPDGIDLAAEVTISPDGKFVYASTRHTQPLDSDSIAIYYLDVASSSATQPSQWLGRPALWSRSHDTSHCRVRREGGLYLAVLNQVSNDLQIFERDLQSGLPLPACREARVWGVDYGPGRRSHRCNMGLTPFP